MTEKGAYAEAGVDVDIEAQASRIMYEASKETFAHRKGRIGEIIAPFDDFSGIKMVNVSALPEGSFFSVGFDTAGTKVEVAQRVGKHDTIAFDVLAMVCDDALVRGGDRTNGIARAGPWRFSVSLGRGMRMVWPQGQNSQG